MGFMFQCFPEFCSSSNLKNSRYFDFFFSGYELISVFGLPL